MHLHVTYTYNMYLQPSVAAEMDSLIRNKWNSIRKEFIQHNKYNPELMYKMNALGLTESVGLCSQVCTRCILHYKEENCIHLPSGNDSCHLTGHMVQWDLSWIQQRQKWDGASNSVGNLRTEKEKNDKSSNKKRGRGGERHSRSGDMKKAGSSLGWQLCWQVPRVSVAAVLTDSHQMDFDKAALIAWGFEECCSVYSTVRLQRPTAAGR